MSTNLKQHLEIALDTMAAALYAEFKAGYRIDWRTFLSGLRGSMYVVALARYNSDVCATLIALNEAEQATSSNRTTRDRSYQTFASRFLAPFARLSEPSQTAIRELTTVFLDAMRFYPRLRLLQLVVLKELTYNLALAEHEDQKQALRAIGFNAHSLNVRQALVRMEDHRTVYEQALQEHRVYRLAVDLAEAIVEYAQWYQKVQMPALKTKEIAFGLRAILIFVAIRMSQGGIVEAYRLFGQAHRGVFQRQRTKASLLLFCEWLGVEPDVALEDVE